MQESSPGSPIGVAYEVSGLNSLKISKIRGAGNQTYLLAQAAKTLAREQRVLLVAGDAETCNHTIAKFLQHGIGGAAAGARYENNEPGGGGGAVFGDYSFAETVGLWLPYGTQPAAVLLDPFISTEGFAFTPTEFVDLRERIATARRRFERLPHPSRGLEDLNTGFFRHQTLADTTDFIRQRLTEFIASGTELHRDYLLALHGHARRAAFAHRADLAERQTTVAHLRTELDRLTAAGRLRKTELRSLATLWTDYQQRHLPEATPKLDADALAVALQAEDHRLTEAAARSARDLQSDGLALNAVTVNPAYGNAERLAALETRLRDLIREVDEAGVYQLPVGGAEAATTPRQLQQLDGLLAQLRNTERHLGELPLFYERRHFWYAQPAHLRRLLAPLLELPAADWDTAFAAWYFERCLERAPDPHADRLDPADLADLLAAAGRPAAEVERLLRGVTIVAPGEKTSPGDHDLRITLAPPPTTAEQPAWHLRPAALNDAEALPVALAGVRNPTLVFQQAFNPQGPPDWTVRTAPAPPPGVRGVALQTTDGTPWIGLADWDGAVDHPLTVFLPRLLGPADGETLLARWEELLAAPALRFLHDHTPDDLTQALLTDGFTAEFLCAALLRAAEAAELEPFDRSAYVAMGEEVRLRCGLPAPAPHPLATGYAARLAASVPPHLIETHVPWRDTYLPLVVLQPDGKRVIYLPDGRLSPGGEVMTEAWRQRELRVAGFELRVLDAYAIWRAGAET